MKNNKISLAICMMVVAIIASIAVVSCKKETQNNLMNNKNESLQAFNPLEIEDMNAYLKDFKQKMQSAVKGDDEALSLEDAAWHLSSLANYDFGNANVTYTDVLMDTMYFQISITEEEITLSDLAATYEEISSAIDTYFNSLTLNNKHFRYIGASITEVGIVAIGLVLTYGDSGKYYNWYPVDTLYYDQYFDSTTVYHACSNGMTALEYMLNSVDSQPLGQVAGRIYLVFDRYEQPLFVDYIDPYGSPNFVNSRIWCTRGYFDEILPIEEMRYYASSYHALGKSFLNYSNESTNEGIACWDLNWDVYSDNPLLNGAPIAQQTYYHILTITIGQYVMASDPDPND